MSIDKLNNMLSEEDSEWEETAYLLSIPGMRESILRASKEPIEGCVDTKIEW